MSRLCRRLARCLPQFGGLLAWRGSANVPGETVFVVVVVFLLLLVIGNIVFSFMAERKNPPIGNFIECDGVRLHYLERGDRAAPLRGAVPWQRLDDLGFHHQRTCGPACTPQPGCML